MIVGSSGGNKECILTLIERKERYSISLKIPNKTTTSVVDALDSLERRCGKEIFKSVFKTITFDNGSEFQDFYSMERSCFNDKEKRTKVYFANAYRSCEHGSNENCNRMYRKYFSKKTDFNIITDELLLQVQGLINHTPRKILNNDLAYKRMKIFCSKFVELFENNKIKSIFK